MKDCGGRKLSPSHTVYRMLGWNPSTVKLAQIGAGPFWKHWSPQKLVDFQNCLEFGENRWTVISLILNSLKIQLTSLSFPPLVSSAAPKIFSPSPSYPIMPCNLTSRPPSPAESSRSHKQSAPSRRRSNSIFLVNYPRIFYNPHCNQTQTVQSTVYDKRADYLCSTNLWKFYKDFL